MFTVAHWRCSSANGRLRRAIDRGPALHDNVRELVGVGVHL